MSCMLLALYLLQNGVRNIHFISLALESQLYVMPEIKACGGQCKLFLKSGHLLSEAMFKPEVLRQEIALGLREGTKHEITKHRECPLSAFQNRISLQRLVAVATRCFF